MLKSKLITVILCTLTTLKLIPGPVLEVAANAEILEPPINQYILEGGVATLTCKTQGATSAFWSINGTTTDHHDDQSRYERLGVGFTNSNNVNLTMTVPAYLSTVVNNIKCIALQKVQHVDSNAARIYVFETFRPDPPLLSIEVIYHSTLPPRLYATIKGRPLWQGYEIREFRVNITNSSSGSLLDQIIAPNSIFENHMVQVQVNDSLFEFATRCCYSLSITATAVSPHYTGESKSNQTNIAMLRTPGNFSDTKEVNPIVFYSSNGTLSHVSLQVQLPDVCTYQNINYTIITEELGVNNETVEVLTLGPYSHQGSGVVSQDVGGPELKEDRRYSVRVRVYTVTGTSESSKYFYSTKRDVEFCSRQSCITTIPLTPSDDASLYKVVMGISLGIVLVLLLAFSVLLVCFCFYHHKTRQQGYGSTHRACNIDRTMVSNPIYGAGQVYDSIDPQSGSLNGSPTQIMPKYSRTYSPNCNVESSLDTVQRTHETMQIIYPTACEKVSTPLSNIYSISGETVDNTKSVHSPTTVPDLPPINNTVLKKSRKDRNKLHLTLPGVPSSHVRSQDIGFRESCHDSMKSEENQYVEMSHTGTLGQQAIQPVLAM